MEQSWQTLQQELEHEQTTAEHRLQIGGYLADMGDPRPGIGVKDGVPDVVWLPIQRGGVVEVKRVWVAETPDEETKVLSVQDFNVTPFYIAKYLVTYAQYQAFIDAEDGFEQLAWNSIFLSAHCWHRHSGH